ncbi:hypothetical protein V8G54_014606 [Vigna mungo]|uniref:Uncharacterized protein n=1 Tax=Vigna mungo TaxID=3915 RepID=A0AAQ3NHV1_VIGMU
MGPNISPTTTYESTKTNTFFKEHLISTTPQIFRFFNHLKNLIMESGCCFCFFSSKKSFVVGRNGRSSSEEVQWGKNDEMLSDRSTFSVKEQEKRLKKALEEEEKVSKEAERVVQWVKHESAKINLSAVKSVLNEPQKESNVL